jgi:hypothetical protein
LKWIGVLSLAVYIASFAIGLGPVFWLECPSSGSNGICAQDVRCDNWEKLLKSCLLYCKSVLPSFGNQTGEILCYSGLLPACVTISRS